MRRIFGVAPPPLSGKTGRDAASFTRPLFLTVTQSPSTSSGTVRQHVSNENSTVVVVIFLHDLFVS